LRTRHRATTNFYTDNHETASNREYRGLWVDRKSESELRSPLWLQLSKADADLLRSAESEAQLKTTPGAAPKLPSGYEFTHEGAEYEEFHVHDSGAFEELRKELPLHGNFSVRFPDGGVPILQTSQDETTFWENLFPAGTWSIGGAQPMRPKDKGASLNLSVFVDQVFGCGTSLTAAQLKTVNEFRRGKKYAKVAEAKHWFNQIGQPDLVGPDGEKKPLQESPGVFFLNAGKNNQGWWDHNGVHTQVDDMMDVYDALLASGSDIVRAATLKLHPLCKADLTRGIKAIGHGAFISIELKINYHFINS